MNKEWLSVMLSLSRLPKEYDDIERISRYVGGIGLIASGVVFLPGSHYVAFAAVSLSMYYLGRVTGLVLHDRKGASHEKALQEIRITRTASFVIVVAVTLTAVLYWASTTHEPAFGVESIFLAASLTWALGTGRAKMILGFADVILVLSSLVCFFFIPRVGFLAAGAFAAFMAWALLWKKEEHKYAPALRTPQSENK